MGVLIGDSKTFDNGLTLSNFVISINGIHRNVEKTKIITDEKTENPTVTIVYRTWYLCKYYASETAYNNSAEPIYTSFHELDMTASQLNSNVFDIIYASIKSNYSTTTDI